VWVTTAAAAAAWYGLPLQLHLVQHQWQRPLLLMVTHLV
jgi:hypothetical protein